MTPDPLNLNDLRFEPLAARPSKVKLADLGCPAKPGASVEDLLDNLPKILGAEGLKRLRDAILVAYRSGNPVVAALGGHVIKTGCAPYLIDLVRRGVIKGLALNGSAAIHDSELAIAGHTSEDVGKRLIGGEFGFARETSALFADACRLAAETRCGLGAAYGEVVEKHGGPGLDMSLLVAARRQGIPLTVHVAVGTDIVHMSGSLDGSALGAATLDDFRLLTDQVATMSSGVWLNLGSAVVLPEVFLKAVSIVRNLGKPLDNLITANLDFQQQYRGLLNVLQRPGAEGIPLTGHHEIMIPLLHAALVSTLGTAESVPHENHRELFTPHIAP